MTGLVGLASFVVGYCFGMLGSRELERGLLEDELSARRAIERAVKRADTASEGDGK